MKESKWYEDVMEEGREQGRREGHLQVGRHYTVALLQVRFKQEVTAALVEVVRAIEDCDRLDHLHRLAATCPSLAEFVEAVAAR